MPILALLQFAKKALLRPIKIRLLVHFGAAFPRRYREWADVDAVSFGALQQGDVPKRRRRRLENPHQVTEHQIVGSDLALIAPAINQTRRLIERGIDEVGRALQFRSSFGALRSIRQIELNVTGAMEVARLAPRQRDHLALPGAAEVPQRSTSHQPRRARDDNLLVRHRQNSGSS